MEAGQRLMRHQMKSGPVLKELREWIEAQFAEHQVEPNSSLGQALRYVLKHWAGLTRLSMPTTAPSRISPTVRWPASRWVER
jgi:hypothetical protein